MLQKIGFFLKKEIVFTVAWVLAIGTAFLVPPDAKYGEYIHWNTLSTLLVLMIVMAGMKDMGVMKHLGSKLLFKASSGFAVEAVLVFATFFSAMAVTNDIALVTFVPFSLEVLAMAGRKDRIIFIVSLQAIAANLGAMLSPVGNPHNIYFYYLGNYTAGEFLRITTPMVTGGFVLLLAALLLKKAPDPEGGFTVESEEFKPEKRLYFYIVVFLVMLFTLTKLINVVITALVILAFVVLIDRQILGKIDYTLLFTFTGFFIFVGNMQRIEALQEIIPSILEGRELIVGVIFSQFMCNLPTSILLSGFTENYAPLIIATDIGGIGTLIASMANLIAYKYLSAEEPELKGRFTKEFGKLSVIFLAAEIALYYGIHGSL